MASSWYTAPTLLLLLLLLVIVVPCEFHESHPCFLVWETRLIPGYAVMQDEWTITQIFVDEEGLKVLSAILRRFSVKAFIWAGDIDDGSLPNNNNRTEQQQVFVPKCSELTMYVRRLEKEKELLQKDPGLLDDLLSGRRMVKRLRKKMVGFDGTRNVSVSGPIIYREWGFGVDEVDGFGSLEFPSGLEETSYSKIEFAVVARVAGRIDDEDADQIEIGNLNEFLGVVTIREPNVPVTMLYSLYF